MINAFLVLVSLSCFAQTGKKLSFTHIDPPNWWVGMLNKDVQVLFHTNASDFSSYKVDVSYPGVAIKNVEKVENPHYLFVTLTIGSDAKPGNVPIRFSNGKKSTTVQYSLLPRSSDKKAQGFDPSDVFYLIMPDRFANGDTKNDSIPGMFEGVHREKDGARHGGDIKGIVNKLDYLQDLGITTLWLNPVLENNQRKASYHGYAITDLYKVDRRFGTNEEYVAFVKDCHNRGLKVVQDMVMNHLGNEHWLMRDLPEKDWVHQFPKFTRSNYRSSAVSDPYRSEADLRLMNDGWFDTTMPDVNQSNPRFATYLIQNTIWWIEYALIDGIRMDTYPYNDKAFMARWCKEVLAEYPEFNIVGEVWIDDVATTAYWQKDAKNKDGYESNLPSVTDFPLFFTLPQALADSGSWDTGLIRLYNLLATDFAYPNPGANLIFLDNHDVSRFYLLCGRSLAKFKMGVAFLLTTRGIPQLYYGTELLMDGDGGHHPNVRLDFPGGWPGDKVNAFTAEGRTPEQNEAFDYLKTLLNWRKSNSVIHAGKLMQFIPEDNIYVYFRYSEKGSVMVILNGNDDAKQISTQRYQERLEGVSKVRNVLTGEELSSFGTLSVGPWTATILELQ